MRESVWMCVRVCMSVSVCVYTSTCPPSIRIRADATQVQVHTTHQRLVVRMRSRGTQCA